MFIWSATNAAIDAAKYPNCPTNYVPWLRRIELLLQSLIDRKAASGKGGVLFMPDDIINVERCARAALLLLRV